MLKFFLFSIVIIFSHFAGNACTGKKVGVIIKTALFLVKPPVIFTEADYGRNE